MENPLNIRKTIWRLQVYVWLIVSTTARTSKIHSCQQLGYSSQAFKPDLRPALCSTKDMVWLFNPSFNSVKYRNQHE